MIETHWLLNKGKTLLLAYDQGLEHGPVDFNLHNINPEYILDITKKGAYNGVIMHHGIAEKYHKNKEVTLIVKLNGKSSMSKTEPYSPQICSVERAAKLGAHAVGYTIFCGSAFEAQMFKEFSDIVEKAHNLGIPVIAWTYPRGQFVQNETSTETLAYAARIGQELGADFVKIQYNNDIEGFKWVIKAAGKAKVIVAGGPKTTDREFLQRAYDVMKAGAVGMAVGRNIWQHKDPLKITRALRMIIFENKTVDEALKTQ